MKTQSTNEKIKDMLKGSGYNAKVKTFIKNILYEIKAYPNEYIELSNSELFRIGFYIQSVYYNSYGFTVYIRKIR